jgi:hypothetical protein
MGSHKDQGAMTEAVVNGTNRAFGKRIGVFGIIFGCRHREMSRPFTIRGESYRTCLDCGARKAFDTKSLRTFGPYYYPTEAFRIREAENG